MGKNMYSCIDENIFTLDSSDFNLEIAIQMYITERRCLDMEENT